MRSFWGEAVQLQGRNKMSSSNHKIAKTGPVLSYYKIKTKHLRQLFLQNTQADCPKKRPYIFSAASQEECFKGIWDIYLYKAQAQKGLSWCLCARLLLKIALRLIAGQ